MPVHAPGPVLLARVALRRARVARRHSDTSANELATLPLIDLLVVLVFFLLSFFDAHGSVCPERALLLPRARHGVALEPAPVISVDAERATLDGSTVAETSRLLATEGPALARLVEALRTARRNFQVLHPGELPGDVVLIRAERGVAYRALRRLIGASAEAGYRGVGFVVEQGHDHDHDHD